MSIYDMIIDEWNRLVLLEPALDQLNIHLSTWIQYMTVCTLVNSYAKCHLY